MIGIQSWTRQKLKHLCTRFADYGANESADSYVDEGVRFLRTTDIDELGKLTPQWDGVFLPEDKAAEYRLKDGDLLLSRSGTIGRSFVYESATHGPCAYAGYLVRFRLRRGVDPFFVFYWTKSKGFQDQVAAEAIQSTIQNFNGQKFASMAFCLPPAGAQHQIANFLDQKTAAVDDLIRKKERLIELLQEKRQALITTTIFGQDACADPDLSRLATTPPTGWKVAPVWCHFRFVKEQGFPSLPLLSVYRDHGVVPKDSRDDNHNRAGEDLGVYQRVLEGDVVINKMKAWQGSVAVSKLTGIVSPDYQVLRPVSRLFLPDFLHFLLRSAPYIAEYARRAYGIRPDQWRLMFEELRGIPLLVPEMEAQYRIADKIQQALSSEKHATDLLLKQTELLREYRQALITAAVTGQLDIPAEAA